MEDTKFVEATKVSITISIECPHCNADIRFTCPIDQLVVNQWESEFVSVGCRDIDCLKCNKPFATFLFHLDVSPEHYE